MEQHLINTWQSAVEGKQDAEALFREAAKNYPPLVSVTFTRQCPMGCKHCVYPCPSKSDFEQNNLKRIEQAILAIHAAGVIDFIHVGRILKSEHLPILKKLREKGMTLSLIDNGMGARLIPEMKQLGVFFNGGIDVSIDGDQAAHDEQRQPGSYDQAVAAVKAFREVADHISITATASAVNYSRIINGLAELQEKLPFVRTFQLTTTSPTHFQPRRMALKPEEMKIIFHDFKKTVKTKPMNLLIYRLEDITAILPELKRLGPAKTNYISMEWELGQGKVEFFPQSIVTAEEFAIDANGRHILPFGLDWHLDERPDGWEMRDDLILTDPDQSYERLVKKYKKTMGEKIFLEEKKVFNSIR